MAPNSRSPLRSPSNKQGMRLRSIKPRCPEQNGKVERSHIGPKSTCRRLTRAPLLDDLCPIAQAFETDQEASGKTIAKAGFPASRKEAKRHDASEASPGVQCDINHWQMDNLLVRRRENKIARIYFDTHVSLCVPFLFSFIHFQHLSEQKNFSLSQCSFRESYPVRWHQSCSLINKDRTTLLTYR